MTKQVSAEQTAAKKKGFGARFMHWYGSYQGKRVVNIIYSLGASVVIIGALFKIMHFPGAGTMLMIGMGIEAFLFAIGSLDDPHPEFHWANVFPQLLEYGTEPHLLEEMQSRPKPTLLGAGVEEGITPAAQGSAEGKAQKGVAVPALNEQDMEALRNGIDNLAKTAVQLGELGNVATVTHKLGEKLDAASEAAGQFAVSGKALQEKSEALGATYVQVAADMQQVVAGTQAYGGNVNAITERLSSLNAVYELQLKALQAQADAYKAQTEKVVAAGVQVDTLAANVKKMGEAAAEALRSQEEYKAGTKQLASQVADLNKVYGNMLNALA